MRIATQIGNIDLELYDADKPITVANFLQYVNAGSYNGTFIQRLVSGFVVQGGGYKLDSSNSPVQIPTSAAIQNEYAVGPTYSNTIGTIAMAKVGSDPNSATSQWFINLADNSANLDKQNGGFTVFGHVISGMDVLTRLNTTFSDTDTSTDVVLNATNVDSAFDSLPVVTWNGTNITLSSLLFTTVSVLPDATPAAVVTPDITIKGGALKTVQAFVKIAGTASSSVTGINWRLGTKGGFRSQAVGASWNLKVAGLKKGTNFVYVVGVASTGAQSPMRKIKVIRR